MPLQVFLSRKNKFPIAVNSLNVEFVVKRIKAQADLKFEKIFGD